MSFAKSFSFSFQIFPSKWELSCGHVAVVKAFVSISILWLLSSLRFSVPHGTGSILSMCFFFFWIRKLWSNLLKVTQLVRSKVGLRPASSPSAQRFPALLITMVAAGAGSSGSQVMPVDTGSWFLLGCPQSLMRRGEGGWRVLYLYSIFSLGTRLIKFHTSSAAFYPAFVVALKCEADNYRQLKWNHTGEEILFLL